MRIRFFGHTKSKKAGMPPESIVYQGCRPPEPTEMYAVAYDEKNYTALECKTLEEALTIKDKGTFFWLNVDGLGNIETVKKIGEFFHLHPLAIEDILSTDQRPRKEDYDDFLMVVLRSLRISDKDNNLDAEQISIFVGKDFILSFQEKLGDAFSSTRDRLRTSCGRLRKLGPDYLMYSMIDTIVDQYFVVMEHFGERIETLETSLVNNPAPETLRELYALKRSGLFLRRAIWPLREAVSSLERGESNYIKRSTQPFLRDVYSHTVEIIDTIETFREMLSSMLDIYLSSVSNKLNGVMKVLTIITTIFMPLSFIAGIYGMNFQYMPELSWQYGYAYALGLMVLVTIIMLFFFRSKRWI